MSAGAKSESVELAQVSFIVFEAHRSDIFPHFQGICAGIPEDVRSQTFFLYNKKMYPIFFSILTCPTLAGRYLFFVVRVGGLAVGGKLSTISSVQFNPRSNMTMPLLHSGWSRTQTLASPNLKS